MQTSEEKIALYRSYPRPCWNSQLFTSPPSLHNNFSFAPLDEIFTELSAPREYFNYILHWDGLN